MDGNTRAPQSSSDPASDAGQMTPSTVTLTELNALPAEAAAKLLGAIVENSPWIGQNCARKRPFASFEMLHAAILAEIGALPIDRLDGLFRLHPELAGAEAKAGAMTSDSTSEQARLGLTSLDPAQLAMLDALNAAYRDKFGFPCIMALRLHDSVASVLRAFEQRIGSSLDEARAANLREIGEIVRGRLEGVLTPQGWLSTHVLDTGAGRPAAGMEIGLSVKNGAEWVSLKSVRSNADGRTDEPLLRARAMKVGVYRLEFEAGAYFRQQGVEVDTPAFVDRVSLEFGVSDRDAHYHVPLLCTPWSYTTYRGS